MSAEYKAGQPTSERFRDAGRLASRAVAVMVCILIASLAAPPAKVGAAFVTPTAITIDGAFTDWGTAGSGVYSQLDSNVSPPDGTGFTGKAEDINYVWTAISTASGGGSAAGPANLISDVYYRFDCLDNATFTGGKFNIQLNLGTAAAGYADHLLQMWVDNAATPKVKITLFTYSTPYPAIAAFTTGTVTGVVSNAAAPYSGYTGAVDANATGGVGSYNGTNYGWEIKVPIGWYGSTYGGAVKNDGTGATSIVGACFSSTGAYGGVGTVKDVLCDASGNTLVNSTSATTGTTTFASTTTITKLAFTTSAQSITAGAASTVMTVQTQSGISQAINVGANTNVALSSSSGTGTFSTTSGGTYTSTLTITIASGASSANFYYKDTAAGTPTITADENPSQSWTAATQQETITAGAATKIRVETAANGSGTVVSAQSVTAGNTVTGYSITRDAYDNFVANAAGTWSLTGKTGGVVDGDLVPAGGNLSAVFTGHVIGTAAMHLVSGSLTATDSGTLTVTAGTATQIRVETAANGSGSVVGAQSVTAGNTVTGYSISRDAYGNFVANVAADSWSLTGKTGGVANGDLVAAGDSLSAVFTGHLVGTGVIHVAKSGLSSTDSGTLTVTAGAATQIRVETAANGSGSVVSAQSIASGSSITVYAISRDAGGNFVANVAADSWSLTGKTGGVADGNLVPAGDSKSAVFTGNLVGTGVIHAVESGLASTDSGTLTVTAGSATQIKVETAANGSGSVVSTQSITSGNSITVYSITRDAAGNFVANAAPDSWSLTGKTGGVADGNLVPAGGNLSAVFTGALVGTGVIHAPKSGLSATDSGTITVTFGALDHFTFTTISSPQSAGIAFSITITAKDAAGNTVTSYTGTNTLSDTTGTIGPTTTGAFVDGVWTGDVTITGAGANVTISTTGGTKNGTSNSFAVNAGTATQIKVETAADGSGSVVGAQSVAAGSSVTGYAITRDVYGNFVANAAGTWSLTSTSAGVTDTDLVPAGDNKSAVFTGHLIGTGKMRVTSGVLTSVDSGTLTVTAGAATQIRVETAADGSGTTVPAQSIVSGSGITAYAITRDVYGNFVANAAGTWSVTSTTGGVTGTDLVPAGDNKSAVFTGHVAGTGKIHVVSGILTSVDSGTLTVTGGTPSIANNPNSYGFGTIWVSSTNNTGLTYFTVTNDGSVTVNITISGSDMAGGTDWTLSDTAAAGADTCGIKAGLEGGSYNVVVKKNGPYNTLVASLAASVSQRWGLQLLAPASFSDTVAKSGTITLTATMA